MSNFEKTNMSFEEVTAVAQYNGGAPAISFDEDERYIMDLTSERKVQFCSMVATTEKDKKTLFKAQNSPDKRLKDCVNMKLKIKDVYVEVVKLEDQNTGEMMYAPRIVLIDMDGVGYQCVSKGVFSGLKKLFNIFGMPTWEKGLEVTPKLVNKGNNNILILDI